MLRKNIFVLLILLYIIGFGFLINNFLVHSKLKSVNEELPIIGFQGLIEKNDSIYIGSSYWNKIFIFDKNGKYLTYQGTGGKGRDFEFYFTENQLVINHFTIQKNKIKNEIVFKIDESKKYIIKNKTPLKIVLENKGKKSEFITQNLFFYIFKSDVGIWFVLMFYALFVSGFYSDYLLKIKERFADK